MEFWVSTNHYRSTEIQLFHGYKMLKVQYLCKVMPPCYRVQSTHLLIKYITHNFFFHICGAWCTCFIVGHFVFQIAYGRDRHWEEQDENTIPMNLKLIISFRILFLPAGLVASVCDSLSITVGLSASLAPL